MDEPLSPPNKTRIENLDVLRGFFVSLALLQHFAYYWNIWFIDHFKDYGSTAFSYYDQFIGKNILLQDPIAYHLLLFFTPWVSQVYLSLAAFNLSTRSKDEFRKVFSKKIKLFTIIFSYFVIENIVVAATLGEAISFYPLMSWMVILTIISVVYKFFDIKGVIALFFLSFIPWFWSDIFIWGDQLERFVRFNVHPYFEYDARLEYFLPSGCLGFIIGHIHNHKEKWGDARYLFAMAIGVAAIGVSNIFGEPFSLNRFDILATEHDLAESFFGTIYILGINTFVIMSFILLHTKNINFKNLKPLHWVGVNSLLIFGLHRILFVHIIAPTRLYLGAKFNWEVYPSFFNEMTHLLIVCLIVLLIQKSKLGKIFSKSFKKRV